MFWNKKQELPSVECSEETQCEIATLLTKAADLLRGHRYLNVRLSITRFDATCQWVCLEAAENGKSYLTKFPLLDRDDTLVQMMEGNRV